MPLHRQHGGVVIQGHVSAELGPGIRPEPCRAQLGRILKSSDFEATERERRFLSYVVEETLAARANRIKAYSVAVEVFGRDASFDPQNDPIVRVEAGHLRRSLDRYYLKAGQSDPIVITIPKGGYVPTFAHRSLPTDVEAMPLIAPASQVNAATGWRKASWPTVVLVAVLAALAAPGFRLLIPDTVPTAPEIPRLLVERFDDLSGTEASAAIASGLTEEVIGQLSKFRDIVVVESADNSGRPPRYALSGTVSMSPDAFRLQIKLVNRRDGAVLWADAYDGAMDVQDIWKAQVDIARNAVTSLAETYGVVYQADATLSLEAPPDDWAAYSCTLSYYAYRVTLDPKARARVRLCLEHAVERFPNYATAWALLAQVSIDDLRFQYPFDTKSTQLEIDRILDMARRATELDPRNVRALHAQMSALFWNREFDSGRKVGEQAMAINPNDTDLMGGFGTRLAFSGSWDEGCALVEQARERNIGPFGYYETTLALCSYFGRDNSKAAMWIKKTPIPNHPLYHLVAAAIFGEGEMKIEADHERAWLKENAHTLMSNIHAEVYRRLGRSEDAEFFLSSLRKAGLDVGS
ncbi:hypothetical protein ACN2CC_03100 [Mesorhizobium muleiense]|uniref:hypothetical protein n=1 Tax=Mesorhizobium muleiense TaxID=1004279 RepID=UPI003AFA0BA1